MHRIRLLSVIVLSSVVARLVSADEKLPPYRDPSVPVEQRINDLIGRMTLDEKITMVHASGLFRAGGVPRLGIPYLWTDDGPQGVREELQLSSWQPAGHTDDFATAMPVGSALASTWNPELAELCGHVIGEEARARGKEVMLGPGLNIVRTPLCGRNYDYYGEDPWLTSRMTVGYVRGLQAENVVECIKHFAANNQESARGTIDVEVDERALREIYLPGFEAGVREGGALGVMGAYNQLRGEHCCHNAYLLNEILKGEWGFKGAVISDWGGTHDGRQAALNGLDLEMGTGKPYDQYYLAAPFKAGIERGDYPVSLLDDKVRRNLRMLYFSGAIDGVRSGKINTPEHLAAERKIAEESIVLLKNDGALLPLDTKKIHSVAVIGENAVRRFAAGGNSAGVKAFREVTALEGITARAGADVNIVYSEGYRHPKPRGWGERDVAGVRTSELTAATPEEVAALEERAVAAAKSSDVVIFVGGLSHQANADDEGSDRHDLLLPSHQDELIAKIVAANPRTVVVLIAGAPVTMNPWLEHTPAVLQASYGGSEAGNALAAVLFGDVNPSGRLIYTFPRALSDSPAHRGGARTYPGENGVVHYDEGLFVGYRWFDAKKIEPLFPFGFGLSYTHFKYGPVCVQKNGDAAASVQCDVTNVGDRAGADVVELYVSEDHPSVVRPEKELKGFAKVKLAPGETKTVSIELGPRAFAYYSPEQKKWVAEAHRYHLLVGSSSRDIAERADFDVERTTFVE